MKQTLVLIFLITIYFPLTAQNFEDLSFGTDTTFEAMTWNIEWFPKNGEVTIDYVAQIIEALDVDLLSIQEVDDISAFNQLIESLDGYEGYLESSYFAGLAYIYKTDVIQINDIYEIYTTSPYWSPFPRSPMVMDLNFMNERIIVINNHFKCCGDGILDLNNPGDEETRRYNASNLLKEYIDENFADLNTIVLGDLNDILTDDPENNVFQQFINDNGNYLFTDMEIASGDPSGWSYPTWPSHIDHILITNELFSEFENDSSVIQTIKLEEYFSGGWWEYEENISDHRPVALKLLMDPSLGDEELDRIPFSLYNYPNPFSTSTSIEYELTKPGNLNIIIFNHLGQLVEKVDQGNYQKGNQKYVWDASGLPSGIYFVQVRAGQEMAVKKLIKLR